MDHLLQVDIPNGGRSRFVLREEIVCVCTDSWT